MKKVAGPLKLLYSQYRELQAFAQFGSDVDADTKARLALGERIVEILKQDKSQPVPVEYQVAILYAAVNGHLTGIPVEKVAQYEKELYAHLRTHYDELMARIRETGVLSDEDTALLRGAIEEMNASFAAEISGADAEG